MIDEKYEPYYLLTKSGQTQTEVKTSNHNAWKDVNYL